MKDILYFNTVEDIRLLDALRISNKEKELPNQITLTIQSAGVNDITPVFLKANREVSLTSIDAIGTKFILDGKEISSDNFQLIKGKINYFGIQFEDSNEHTLKVSLIHSMINQSTFENNEYLIKVTIGTSITSIGSDAFSGCSSLTSVTIPNSVTSIGDWAFSGCSGLTSVTIGNSVTEIGQFAFSSCTGLTSVDIGNSVPTINAGAFSGCSSLTSVNITDLASWCNIVFCTEDANPLSYAHNLYLNGIKVTNLVIPNTVTAINDCTFYNCTSLTSVTIPNSVTLISGRAFISCTGLTSIVVESGNTKYDSRNNCNAIIETATNTLITGCMNTIIPNSVTSIGWAAFEGCTGLTSVTIPNSVTSIGWHAFAGCTGLKSVTIPNSVTSISDYAFSGCSGLTSVTIFGQGAWYYNSSKMNGLGQIISQLKTVNIGCGITSLRKFGFTPDVINCYAETPPTCSSSTFYNYDSDLHVPTTSIANYFMADYWQNFNIINDLSKVTLDKENADIVLWETLALTATVIPVGDEVLWTSTNPWVAAVDENGVVTATGGGECDIYATLASSHDAEYAICHINVSHAYITLSLSEDSLEMNVGDEHILNAFITPDNTGLIPTWSSTDESVAVVEDGVVIAVGKGECDITATVLDQTAICHVTVTNNVTITLNIESAIIGASQMLTVYPSCAPDVPVELVVTSSDPSVAVARVVNRTNAPAEDLLTFTEKDMVLAHFNSLESQYTKAPAYASEKAITIVGVKNGTATITVTTANGKATPAILELRVVDVNSDNVVTAADVTALYDYLLNEDLTYYDTSDINGDGNITAADITAVYNLLLGN